MKSELSPREREVLELSMQGLTDAEIAAKLNITPGTVNSYWVRIRGKMGHLSRTELVARDIRRGEQMRANDLRAQSDADFADQKALLDAALIEVERLRALLAKRKAKGS